MTTNTILEGARIRLRDWTPADIAAYAHWNQPGQAWQALDGPYYERPDAAAMAKRIETLRGRIEAGAWPEPRERLAVADEETDALVGMVSRYWLSRETHWLALGIVIYDPQQWQRGIGFEALGLWTDHLFDALPELARLDLRTWSGNAGMMALAAKLGFTLEARFRKARIVESVHHDGLGYGVLREEWLARYPDGFREHARASR